MSRYRGGFSESQMVADLEPNCVYFFRLSFRSHEQLTDQGEILQFVTLSDSGREVFPEVRA